MAHEEHPFNEINRLLQARRVRCLREKLDIRFPELTDSLAYHVSISLFPVPRQERYDPARPSRTFTSLGASGP